MMNRTAMRQDSTEVHSGWRPAGRFLDDLPDALYALAHVMFLAVGAWLLVRANDNSLPYAGAFALYIVSQVGFLAFFAKLVTMKMAVLLEQTLVFAMLLLIVLRAT